MKIRCFMRITGGKILNRSGIYFLLFWEVVIQEGKLSRGGNTESHYYLSQ